MPNLVKQRYVMSDNRVARVIDSNEKLNAIYRDMNLQREDNQGPPTFEEGIFAERVELSEDYDAFYDENASDQNAFSEPSMQMDEVNQMIESMLEEARQEAQGILEQAQADAERIKEDAYNEGYQQGEAKAKELYQQKELDLDYSYSKRENALEEEYMQKMNEMEPQLVDAFANIIKDVLCVDISDYSGIVSELVLRTVVRLDNPKKVSIYVSADNLSSIKDAESRLVETLGNGVELDLLRDDTLNETQCKIETERGIYDCGFDTQLENLLKKNENTQY